MPDHWCKRTFTAPPGGTLEHPIQGRPGTLEHPIQGRCRAVALCNCGAAFDGWGNTHAVARRSAGSALWRHIDQAPILDVVLEFVSYCEATTLGACRACFQPVAERGGEHDADCPWPALRALVRDG